MYNQIKYDNPIVYAAKHKNNGVRLCSQSGGMFAAISDYFLNNNGVIYGCVLNDEFKAVHIRTNTFDGRNKMHCSKYVQSDLNHTFKNVKEDLLNNNLVLFSGTSCQIAGLNNYLGNFYDNLYTVDIVCHGVPSPKVWKDYLKWNEKKYHSTIVKAIFRDKKYGWSDHAETLCFKNNKSIKSRVYTTLFYGHNTLRPSCYICPFKTIHHPSNITIADYWGIDKAAPGFNDKKGISLVLINDDKGKKIFEAIKNDIVFINTKIENSLQLPLRKPCNKPLTREQFWIDYNKMTFDKIAYKYGGLSIIGRLKNLKKMLNKKKNIIMHKM